VIRVAFIRAALERRSVGAIGRAVIVGLAFTAITVAAFALILFILGKIFPRIYAKLESKRKSGIPSIRVQRMELLSSDRLTDGLIFAAKTARIVALLVLVFNVVPLLLSFFPWTAPLADTVFEWITTPLRGAWSGFVDYLPSVFSITVIMAVIYGLNKFIRLLFLGLESGRIKVAGFYREWADPTYKIVRFVVIAFGAIMIWPYLPGSGSAAFQGVSVFLGVLITFGSASAIANVVAGIVMTYMRPFMIGDRVRIADTVGDVTKRTLLITRVRTVKNVDVTIPNAMVLSSHIVNYSSSATHKGLILHTSVTLGYDAPWRKVHEALLAAAAATEGVLSEPSPFVLQTALNDHHVSYELNAYTNSPTEMATLYSRLHQNIQDKCNEAGIEILSPAYSSVRDGSHSTMPEEYLPKDYQAPGWRVFPGTPTY
jgi:small-conductance mechanosensitive channel